VGVRIRLTVTARVCMCVRESTHERERWGERECAQFSRHESTEDTMSNMQCGTIIKIYDLI